MYFQSFFKLLKVSESSYLIAYIGIGNKKKPQPCFVSVFNLFYKTWYRPTKKYISDSEYHFHMKIACTYLNFISALNL